MNRPDPSAAPIDPPRRAALKSFGAAAAYGTFGTFGTFGTLGGAAATALLPGCGAPGAGGGQGTAPGATSGAAAGTPAGTAPGGRPPADATGFRIPGEFEPTQAVWLGYDEGHAEFTAALAAALQPHVRLKVLARDAGSSAAARTLLQARGLRVQDIEFHAEAKAMYFLRDAAVFATGPQGVLGVIDFAWNHYGRPGWCQTRHPGDARARAECTGDADRTRNDLDRWLAEQVGGPVFESTLFMEGGGIESNGQGLLIANEALLRQRHPDWRLDALVQAHRALPGVRKVVVVPEGLAEDPPLRATITGSYVGWGTGGHTDEFVRFADANTVLLAWPDDADAAAHPVARLNRQRMQRNLDVLARASDAEGRPLRVLKVPMPRTIERRVFLSAAADPAWSRDWSAGWFPPSERRREGDPVLQVASASYLNFVVANGVVVLPGYVAHGTPRAVQDRVRRLFEGAFPKREIRFVDALGANWVGGGPHCATLNEPLPETTRRSA